MSRFLKLDREIARPNGSVKIDKRLEVGPDSIIGRVFSLAGAAKVTILRDNGEETVWTVHEEEDTSHL